MQRPARQNPGRPVTNNDILRRLRYTFDFNDAAMIRLFALSACVVSRSEVSDWLKAEDDPQQQPLNDKQLATFLNGLIIEKRGKREGPMPAAEKRLTNNLILKKLRIALNLKDDDLLAILARADLSMSKHELSALFRKPGHKNYRECKDQVLRNFLKGLQLKLRRPSPWDAARLKIRATSSDEPKAGD